MSRDEELSDDTSSTESITKEDKVLEFESLNQIFLEKYDIPMELTAADDLCNTGSISKKDFINNRGAAKQFTKRFKAFLRKFKNPDGLKYRILIEKMVAEQRDFLVIEFNDLLDDTVDKAFANFLPDAPLEVTQLFRRALTKVIVKSHPDFASTSIDVRISGFPDTLEVNQLKKAHRNKFITISGFVIVESETHPHRLNLVRYNCAYCGHLIGLSSKKVEYTINTSYCPRCKNTDEHFLKFQQVSYEIWQRLIINNSPNIVKNGIDYSKEILLTNSLCNTYKIGDKLEVTGVLTTYVDSSYNQREICQVYSPIFIANYVLKKKNL